MTKRSTKQQLLLSAISLLLCVSMLVGSTFAWFTDSVTSTNNIIKSGTLDVELYYQVEGQTDWTKVTKNTNVFKDGALWEPGYTEVVKLKVVNEGTLALKYKLGVNVVSEIPGTLEDKSTFKLSEHIKFGIVDGAKEYTRDEAIKAVDAKATLLNTAYNSEVITLEPKNDKDTDEKIVTMVVYMPTTVGNEANYRGTQPVINLGINLFATQLEYEGDSFGKDYDKDADFYPAWDGTTGEVPEADADDVITITSAAELAALAAKVNAGTSYAGKTVKLGTNINLGNTPWTPIGACDSASYFQGTFDGQGYTIYGLNVDNSADDYMYSTAGLFGWIDTGAATIKNVTISGATVKGSHWTGALVGYMSGNVIECTVEDSTIIGVHVTNDADGDKIGGLVGYVNKGELTGNKVIGCTVQGNRDVGGLVGSCAAAATEMNNNTVKDTTVVYQTEKSYASGDKIISGRTGYVPNATNVADNVTVLKGNMVAPGVVEVGTRSYEVTSTEGLLNVNDIIAASSTGEGVGIKVKLLADIDLAGETWNPIDKMWIEFDGNGRTISNLTADAWKAGLFGYLGGGYIKNLTLENVNVTGAQAGAFAGAFEGTIDNCTLKGDNYITYAPKYQYNDPNGNLEASGGIGAITGVAQPLTVNATIESGATVTLDYNNIVTNVAYVNELTGYIATTAGTIENNGKIIVLTDAKDDAALADAITNGASVVRLSAGEYTIPDSAKGKTLSIIGNGSTAVKVVNDGGSEGDIDYSLEGADITFENVTLNIQGSNYPGYARIKSATYNNCTIVGSNYALYGDSVFNDCTFNLNNGYVWTWGAPKVEFNNCTFEDTVGGKAKAILVHNTTETVVTVKDCTFKATTSAQTWDGIQVAAVSIDPENGSPDATVNFLGTNTVSDAFYALYQVKYADEVDDVIITVNGEKVSVTAMK